MPFSEWPSIFPNAATATALIDRVVHHAEIITIEGESYRRRVAAALILLFSLVVSGQIKLRRIDGWRMIAAVLGQQSVAA